ncbi:MAG: hypothetical protein R3C26_02605 [Calditrichia bacterium]
MAQLPDYVMVSKGMINRFHYDDSGKVIDYEFLDRYGKKIELEAAGEHYSIHREAAKTPQNAAELDSEMRNNAGRLRFWIRENLAEWNF